MLPGDVEARFAAGSDAAIIPIWSIEQHGPHLLLGTDSYFASGVAREVGRLSGAAVIPPMPCSWVGCTNAFSGGIGVRESVFVEYLRAVVKGLWRGGFRRIMVLNAHGGNWAAMNRFPQDVLLEDHIPVLSIYWTTSPAAMKLDSEARGGEGTGLTGALRMLGREDLVAKVLEKTRLAVEEFGDNVPVSFEPRSGREARRLGAVGHDYSHECQHVRPESGIDPDAGVLFLRTTAEHIVGCLDPFAGYVQRLLDEGVARV
jgi:creatinine amidohydrolase